MSKTVFPTRTKGVIMKYIYNPTTNNLDKTEDIGKKEEGLFENLPILNQGINAPKDSSKVKKKFSSGGPINKTRETFFFDRPEGINHVTKTLETFEDMKPGEAKLLNKEMKLGVLKHEIDGLKPFDNFDKTTYPSDPETRRRLKNISKIETDLGYVAKPTIRTRTRTRTNTRTKTKTTTTKTTTTPKQQQQHKQQQQQQQQRHQQQQQQ